MSVTYESTYKVLGRAHKSSTGIADVATLAAPAGARAFLISVATGAAIITADGTTPAANVGLVIPVGYIPTPTPVGSDLKVAGNAVASEIEVVWLG